MSAAAAIASSPIHRDGAFFFSKMAVPAACVGRLIGTKGANLTTIREASGVTDITVEKRGGGNIASRQVEVWGYSAEAVAAANTVVSTALYSNRDPLAFKDCAAVAKPKHHAAVAATQRRKKAAAGKARRDSVTSVGSASSAAVSVVEEPATLWTFAATQTQTVSKSALKNQKRRATATATAQLQPTPEAAPAAALVTAPAVVAAAADDILFGHPELAVAPAASPTLGQAEMMAIIQRQEAMIQQLLQMQGQTVEVVESEVPALSKRQMQRQRQNAAKASRQGQQQ